MKLFEREIKIPIQKDQHGLLIHFRENLERILSQDEIPIRFAVTDTTEGYYHCEVGLISASRYDSNIILPPLFEFRRRPLERTEHFNVVMIVPTGIGAEIGGDAGDAAPVARMLASQCDHLIIHPNVVNASDINEMSENSLYVEGSVLSRLIMGTIGLQKVRSNRVLVLIGRHEDSYFTDAAINSVSAARAAVGLDCNILKMDSILHMKATYSSSGRAIGEVEGVENLLELLKDYSPDFDAMAITSVINLTQCTPTDYFRNEMVNPWGGVEALLTHAVSTALNVQSAHSPMMETRQIMNEDLGIVDPRKAAEAVSLTFLNCILKGLHRSPRIITDQSLLESQHVISASDLSCIIIPDDCLGLPTIAALEQGIPVIAVKENRSNMKNDLNLLPFPKGKLLIAENYLEAAGIIASLKAGVSIESVRRPIQKTTVHELKELQGQLAPTTEKNTIHSQSSHTSRIKKRVAKL
jgi:hypothetical protein